MALPSGLPIVDHHCHLSPTGEGVEAARRFERAGGTHLFLATQQYGEAPPTTVARYEEQFETTDTIARRIEDETRVRVYRVVAPYPVDLLRLEPILGLSEARQVVEGALELAGRWVREGRAVALGEIGRPHFPTEPPLRAASEDLFRRALEIARDADCPAVVHCEDLDEAGYAALAGLAAQAGFPIGRLIKHYAREWIPPERRAGVVPSFLAQRDVVARSVGSPGPWFWETDFLDDPRRPGAVLDLATIPRRAAAWAQRGKEAVEALRVPFETSIRSVYGFTPSVAEHRSG